MVKKRNTYSSAFKSKYRLMWMSSRPMACRSRSCGQYPRAARRSEYRRSGLTNRIDDNKGCLYKTAEKTNPARPTKAPKRSSFLYYMWLLNCCGGLSEHQAVMKRPMKKLRRVSFDSL